MTVQSPEEGFLSVEVETVFFEFCGTETHFHFLHIQHLADFQQGYPAGIENRMLRVPGLHHRTVDVDNAGCGKSFAHQLPLPFHQLHQHDTAGGIVKGGFDLQGRQIRRGDIQVFNVAFFPHIQPHFPI